MPAIEQPEAGVSAPDAGAAGAAERRVLADAFYLARFTADWPHRSFWMLRRCVVPYVTVRQFLVLKKDGLPAAFAGWAFEQADAPMPWREYRYLPSGPDISEFAAHGRCVITEIISPFLPAQRVVEAVAGHLHAMRSPAWIEFDAERKIVAVHEEIVA